MTYLSTCITLLKTVDKGEDEYEHMARLCLHMDTPGASVQGLAKEEAFSFQGRFKTNVMQIQRYHSQESGEDGGEGGAYRQSCL